MKIAASSIVVMRALPTGQPRLISEPDNQPPRIEPILEPV
jgi:hypothetical protein